MSNKRHIYQYVNILIMLTIGISLLFLNQFTNSKLKELEISSKEAMMLNDNLMLSNREELSKYLKNYRPEAYKRIEIYDDKFNSVFSIILDNSDPTMNIKDHPELMKQLQTLEEGQTTFEHNNYEANIYFKWNIDDNGKLLYMIYSRRSIIKYLWLFNFICGGVMCLVFVSFLLNHFFIYKLSIKCYSLIRTETENTSSRY